MRSTTRQPAARDWSASDLAARPGWRPAIRFCKGLTSPRCRTRHRQSAACRAGATSPSAQPGDHCSCTAFSKANPQRLYLPAINDPEYHYESINVETQLNNPHSLLWWMKRLIALRKRYKAFGRGQLEFLYPENRKVLAFLREYENERILVVVNLSRHSQYVEMDLSRFRGSVPLELFGHTEFAAIAGNNIWPT